MAGSRKNSVHKYNPIQVKRTVHAPHDLAINDDLLDSDVIYNANDGILDVDIAHCALGNQ
jgi:hypothetical protein